MAQTVKIAISLPADLLAAAECERAAHHESRSQFFRRAVEALLAAQRQRDEIARYVASYREQPETAEEVATASALSSVAFDPEGWV
jgi:metal-responsive CopG/Arc/MetJ family transcriptional regulator